MTRKVRKKGYTLMVIPHSEDAPFSIKVSISAVQALGILVIFVFSILLILGNDYFQMKSAMAELDQLRETVIVQREYLDYFAKETFELQERMRAVEKMDMAIRELLEFDSNTIINEPKPSTMVMASRSSGSTLSLATTMLTNNIDYVRSTINTQQESLVDLKESVEEYNDRMASTPSIWPTNGRVTSPFGWRRSPTGERISEFHRGIDIGNDRGAPIYATAKGRVTFVGWRGAYGRMVIIDHGYGFTTLYAHMSRYGVKEGQYVEKGQVIGYVGESGRATGPHVHYEVHVRGTPVNPRDYF